jgi:hypothetical protein
MKQFLALFIFFLTLNTLIAQEKFQSIEGGLSAINSYRKLRGNGDPNVQAVIQSRDGYESPMATWGAFINYRRQLTNRFTINGGLAYERLGYLTRLEARYSSQVVPGQGFVLPPPNGSPNEYIFHDIHHVVSVPVVLEYYFLKRKRFEWYVKAGFSADFMANHYIVRRAYYTDGSVKKAKYPDASFNGKAATVSHTGGIGGEYKLTDKSGIRFNLMYSQNLLAFNSNPVKLHLQWVALNISYNYRLK